MRKFDPDHFQILSEMLVNLSSAWFAAAFIVPNYQGLNSWESVGALTGDVFFCILFWILALKFRKLAKPK